MMFKNPPTPTNWGLCFACVVLSVLGIVFSTGIFFLFFDKPYLTYKNLPFPAITQVVHAGDVVILDIIRCNADKQTHVYNTTHSLVEVKKEVYTILPDVRVKLEHGCTQGKSEVNRTPINLPAGRYKVIGTAEVPGLLRMHQVDWFSQEFDVVTK
jgi:hypothetical protein